MSAAETTPARKARPKSGGTVAKKTPARKPRGQGAEAAETPKPTRKRTAAAAVAPKPEMAVAPPAPATPVEDTVRREARRAHRVLATLLAASVVAAGAALLLVGDAPSRNVVRGNIPSVLTAGELASRGADGAYWAGELPGRTLEYTMNADGAFVRYLPAGSAAGDAGRELTIASYPAADAYARVSAGAKDRRLTFERLPRSGLAVWSRYRPTSVYVAFPGVPRLIEVYSPSAPQALALVRSGSIAPVG